MNIQPGKLEGVFHLQPRLFRDDRGYFFEAYNQTNFNAGGIDLVFVQDNQSFSSKGTLRGLHFQKPQPQDKLVRVLSGQIFDVAVDIRRDSPTFGQWESRIISSDEKNQMLIPVGFAHGFQVLSDTAEILYKCTDTYFPSGDRGILWSDPDLDIPWPLPNPLLSEKDRNLPRLKDLPEVDQF